MAVTKIEDVFEKMPETFQADVAVGVDAVFQFKVSGPEGGDWHVIVRGGACRVEKGLSDNPTTTLQLADKDFLPLMTGQLSGMQAYMTGKLKLSGDIMKSQLLAKMFKF
jgi:putative sterol carrier protein